MAEKDCYDATVSPRRNGRFVRRRGTNRRSFHAHRGAPNRAGPTTSSEQLLRQQRFRKSPFPSQIEGPQIPLRETVDHWSLLNRLRMDKMLYPYLLFWGIGLLFFTAEWLYPARPICYRSVFWRDLLALGAYNLSFMLVVMGTDRIPVPQYMPATLYHLPTICKLILFYVVEDFCLYAVLGDRATVLYGRVAVSRAPNLLSIRLLERPARTRRVQSVVYAGRHGDGSHSRSSVYASHSLSSTHDLQAHPVLCR